VEISLSLSGFIIAHSALFVNPLFLKKLLPSAAPLLCGKGDRLFIAVEFIQREWYDENSRKQPFTSAQKSWRIVKPDTKEKGNEQRRKEKQSERLPE
jgi:hypothetical protein